jgi:HD-GYP domain-containing protein (c-di-GMP phosphodiesterase class II)
MYWLYLFTAALLVGLGFMVFRLRALLSSKREDLMGMVITLSRMMEMRDSSTEGHCSRVKGWITEITTLLNIEQGLANDIVIAAILHDIGKIGIPDDVLLKRGGLTPEEFSVMRSHPEIGALALSSVGRFDRVAEIIKNHHENFDGSGYPSGKRGREIPLGARIVAVLDAYDAMTSDRCYRAAMPKERAIAILRDGAGGQFDPEVVNLFCTILEEKREGRIDPVCGMTGNVFRFVDWEGRRYYFCSAACRNEFQNDPGKYMDHGEDGA